MVVIDNVQDALYFLEQVLDGLFLVGQLCRYTRATVDILALPLNSLSCYPTTLLENL